MTPLITMAAEATTWKSVWICIVEFLGYNESVEKCSIVNELSFRGISFSGETGIFIP